LKAISTTSFFSINRNQKQMEFFRRCHVQRKLSGKFEQKSRWTLLIPLTFVSRDFHLIFLFSANYLIKFFEKVLGVGACWK
jgi:hypothetical protein